MTEQVDIIIARTVNEAKAVRGRLALAGINIPASLCFGRRSVRAIEGQHARIVYTTEEATFADQPGYETHPMKWARWRVRKNIKLGKPGAIVYLEKFDAASEAV